MKHLVGWVIAGALSACSPIATDAPPDAPPAPSQTGGYAAGDPLALWPLLEGAAAVRENIVYSPVSITQAVGLVHLGARGETARQIEAFLGTGTATDRTLAEERRALVPSARSPVRVSIANALFLSTKFRFRASYLQGAKSFYDATATTVDFMDRPVAAAATINRWAKDATEGLIPQVTDAAAIQRDAAAYLANATFFEGGWQDRFTKTDQSKFLFGDGTERDFMLMSGAGRFATVSQGEWKAVRLPYGDPRFVMDVMLPAARRADLPAISPGQIASLSKSLGQAEKQALRPIMPKFQASMKRDLIPPLRKAGLTSPFDQDRADLSGMIEDGQPWLYIDEAYQVAKLEVFEAGTRAAAVTVMVPVPVSAPPPFTGQDFRVDHPFLFAIRDLETGAILFFGRIAAPEPFTGTPKPF